ncbi:MAG: CvpA family protein [candidate division WOR-3 bacterium]|nr:CvpA family protein [candidate division WOR-3 bacterium]
MVWLDVMIFAVIVIAAIYGLVKGLIRGLFGIVALIAGIWIACRYFRQFATRLPFSNPTLSNVLSFIIILFAVLIGVSIISFIVRKAIHFASLGWIDRIFGLIFGFFIGVFINWVICILILSFAPNGKDVIANSRFAPGILSSGSFFKKYFPKPRQDERGEGERMGASLDIGPFSQQAKNLVA